MRDPASDQGWRSWAQAPLQGKGGGTFHTGTFATISSSTDRPTQRPCHRRDRYLFLFLPNLGRLSCDRRCIHPGPSPEGETVEGRLVPPYDVPKGQFGGPMAHLGTSPRYQRPHSLEDTSRHGQHDSSGVGPVGETGSLLYLFPAPVPSQKQCWH